MAYRIGEAEREARRHGFGASQTLTDFLFASLISVYYWPKIDSETGDSQYQNENRIGEEV